jgi:hypothetical protein
MIYIDDDIEKNDRNEKDERCDRGEMEDDQLMLPSLSQVSIN